MQVMISLNKNLRRPKTTQNEDSFHHCRKIDNTFTFGIHRQQVMSFL